MKLIPLDSSYEVADWAAKYIINKINKYATSSNLFVLGLPTGSTPLLMYSKLIDAYKKGEVSFKNVATFNMDEYIGIDREHPQSYRTFMFENFFNHIDISKDNIHLLDGQVNDVARHCMNYEDRIKEIGGIDLFVGGVGEDGHIAFNEPYSSISSRTRPVYLTMETRLNNSRFFEHKVDLVPIKALTVGVSTIMDAKEVMILATGNNKASAVHMALEGGINHQWTISALQMHSRALIVADKASQRELKVKTVEYFCEISKLTER
jgi:glucosamine-6-phosphate deaminase